MRPGYLEVTRVHFLYLNAYFGDKLEEESGIGQTESFCPLSNLTKKDWSHSLLGSTVIKWTKIPVSMSPNQWDPVRSDCGVACQVPLSMGFSR